MKLFSKLGKVLGAVSALSLGAFASSATPLDTALDSITSAATTGISSIQSHGATVIAAVFGVVLLFVGAKHLFSATKQR